MAAGGCGGPRAGQSDDPVRTGYRSGSGYDVCGTGIMSQFCHSGSSKAYSAVLYRTVQISTPINDRGPHERKIKKCAFAQGIERERRGRSRKSVPMMELGKANVYKICGFWPSCEISLTALGFFFQFFFFLRTQISLSYHPPDLYHSRTRGGD